MDYEPRIPPEFAAGKEWLVTNGLGGYASGMIAGPPQRRHDGILVAALDANWGRTVMLDRIDETLSIGGSAVPLFDLFSEFRLVGGLPVWRFKGGGLTIERRLVMPYRQNSTWIEYRLIEGVSAALFVRPWFHMRRADGWLDQPLPQPRSVRDEEGRIEIRMGEVPPVRLFWASGDAVLTVDGDQVVPTHRSIEAERDYPPDAPLWSSCALAVTLGPDGASLLTTAEDWPTALAMNASQAWDAEQARRRSLIAAAHPVLRDGEAAQMVLAADSFLFTPQGRPEMTARARAEGEELCSIVAGYPWFNDWGRDTMISLEGLTLVTGRHRDARRILGTFSQYVRDGLIPCNVPDGRSEGVYNAVDATLWFFHAIDRYVVHSGDGAFLTALLPKLADIVEHHRRGTRFGIGVDPVDGLLRQGEQGVMLTWMDSSTPRRGKAVEINALWYNALCLMAGWLKDVGDAVGAARARSDANRARESFNRRFWNRNTGYLYDLVDGENGDDPACRPNQLFAVSLPHPILDPQYWPGVVEAARMHLLTPFGLRTLSPDAADYRRQYVGNLESRDFAYHRGTVWPWLIGAYADAWLRVHPEDHSGVLAILSGFLPHLDDFAVGTFAEVFDGDPPHDPRGCTAQAWSVAEWLRVRVDLSARARN